MQRWWLTMLAMASGVLLLWADPAESGGNPGSVGEAGDETSRVVVDEIFTTSHTREARWPGNPALNSAPG